MAEATQANKVSLREALRLNGRALGLLWKERPQLILSMALSSAAGSPRALHRHFLFRAHPKRTSRADAQTLARLVFWALIAAALGANARAGAGAHASAQACTGYGKNPQFSHAAHGFRARGRFSHARPASNCAKSNWGRLVCIMYFSLEDSSRRWQVAGAVALSVSLFTLPVPESAGALTALNHPAFILLLIAAMLGTTALAPLLSYRADQYWLRSAENGKKATAFSASLFSLVGLSKNWLMCAPTGKSAISRPSSTSSSISFARRDSWIACRGRGAMGLLMAASASISHLFTALVYGFVCLKAYGGAFGIGSVTQYIGAITSLSGGLFHAASKQDSAQQCCVPARHL